LLCATRTEAAEKAKSNRKTLCYSVPIYLDADGLDAMPVVRAVLDAPFLNPIFRICFSLATCSSRMNACSPTLPPCPKPCFFQLKKSTSAMNVAQGDAAATVELGVLFMLSEQNFSPNHRLLLTWSNGDLPSYHKTLSRGHDGHDRR